METVNMTLNLFEPCNQSLKKLNVKREIHIKFTRKCQQKYEKALSKDVIYNLVLLAYQLNGFISEILVYPDLLAVVALPEIIETFEDIIELKSDEPVYLVYDKTFNLG